MKIDNPSPSEAEIAFVAGFYEGEGSVTVKNSSRNKIPRMRIDNCNPEPLQRCADIFGGKVSGPYGPYKGGINGVYIWERYGKNCLMFFDYIKPWLSERRKTQVENALKEYELSKGKVF